MNILIRADASHIRGIGHVSKQLVLARKLQNNGHRVLFVTRKDKVAFGILNKSGIEFMEFAGELLSPIDNIIKTFKPELVILDILDTTHDYIEALKNKHVKVVTFDNTDESAFECDLLFNIMYYHKPELRKKYDRTFLYEGHKYIIVDEKYENIKGLKRTVVERILLTQGGADTTEKVPFLMGLLKELRKELDLKFKVDVVIGRAFSQKNIERIEELAISKDFFRLNCFPDGLDKLISNCDMVITGGGTTMWEVSACKRPMYIYINEEFEDETARIIKGLGFGLYDGYLPDNQVITRSLKKILNDGSIRRSLIENMKNYDISSGLDRVVDKMYEHNVLS